MSSNLENSKRKKNKNDNIKAKLRNMSKEAIQAAISKKKECNARALEIVQQLIEPDVEEQWLLENLKHINQCHFQDIVEERAITLCCGYPLCDKKLSNVPNKIYKISTKENKVYDITDRKNYCSNVCYKAGVYLKDQLYTSPLWLRDCEVNVKYKILLPKLSGSSGLGAEVDLGNTSPVKVTKEKYESTCNKANSISNESCNDFNEHDVKHKSLTGYACSEKLSSDTVVIESNVKELEIKISDENHDLISAKKQYASRKIENRTVSMKTRKKVEVHNHLPEDIVLEMEKKIKSWLTIDTLIYLLGEKGLKELLKLNGSSLEEMESLKCQDTQMYEKYQDIYRRLDLLELKERLQEKRDMPNKPLPNYEQLKDEAKILELKVCSYFRGEEEYTIDEEVNSEGKKITEDQYPNLPLLDHVHLILTRRKILLEKLDRMLPDIQSALDLSQFRLGTELLELVATFSLGPSNICLRASQWSLVCLIIIKLLTMHNEILRYSYAKELTQKRLTTFLLTYDLDGGYIDRLASYLVDVEQLGTIAPF